MSDNIDTNNILFSLPEQQPSSDEEEKHDDNMSDYIQDEHMMTQRTSDGVLGILQLGLGPFHNNNNDNLASPVIEETMAFESKEKEEIL